MRRCLNQFKVSKFAVRALHTLVAHPGATASIFGPLSWPEIPLQRSRALAGIHLARLRKKRLVFSVFDRRDYMDVPGPKPRKCWFVTDDGYDVYIATSRRAAHQS